MSLIPLTNEYQPVIILGKDDEEDAQPYDESMIGKPGTAERLCEILDCIAADSIDHTVRRHSDGYEVIFVKLKGN